VKFALSQGPDIEESKEAKIYLKNLKAKSILKGKTD